MRKRYFAGLLNFWIFLVLSLGIALGRFVHLYFFNFFLSVFSLAAVYYFYRKNKFFASDIAILFSFFFIGACMVSCFNPHKKVERFLGKRSDIILRVTALPKPAGFMNTFTAKIKSIDSVPLKIKVKVRDYSGSMEYLSSYRLKGKITKRNYHSKPFYYLFVKTQEAVEEVPCGALGKLNKASVFYTLNVFKKNCAEEAYKFLSSVFLGRKELLGGEKEFFINAGAAHLLAISGLHLGLTSLILFFILKLFGLRHKTCLVVSLIFLYFYTFFTGASPSTLRAAVMYSVFVTGFFLKRRVNPLNSLGLAGIAAFMMDTSALFDVGFQLSFLACFAIILGFKIFDIKPAKNLVLNYLKQILFCSFFAAAALIPLTSYYFGKIHILSVFYNVILIPLFTFILMVNFLLIILSPFAFIARALGEVLSALISFFIALIQRLSCIRFSFISCVFTARAVFFYYFFLAASLTIPLFLRGRVLFDKRGRF